MVWIRWRCNKDRIMCRNYETRLWITSSDTPRLSEVLVRKFVQEIANIKLDIIVHRVEEYWDPQLDGLEPIIATREIPAIHILLTLDEISDNLMGHQFSKTGTKFWAEKPSNTSRGNRNGNKDGSNSDNQSRRNDRNRRVQKAGGPNKTAGGSSNNRSADMEINK